MEHVEFRRLAVIHAAIALVVILATLTAVLALREVTLDLAARSAHHGIARLAHGAQLLLVLASLIALTLDAIAFASVRRARRRNASTDVAARTLLARAHDARREALERSDELREPLERITQNIERLGQTPRSEAERELLIAIAKDALHVRSQLEPTLLR